MKAARHTYRDGLWAETLAALLLQAKGYRIIARRYKTPVGEIDLIARRGNTLVFSEVKGRADMRSALECVNPHMRARIESAARHFIGKYPQSQECDMRFDVIAVGWPCLIRHLDNAWRPAA